MGGANASVVTTLTDGLAVGAQYKGRGAHMSVRTAALANGLAQQERNTVRPLTGVWYRMTFSSRVRVQPVVKRGDKDIMYELEELADFPAQQMCNRTLKRERDVP